MTTVTREQLAQALADEPYITQSQLAERLGLPERWVLFLLRKFNLKTARAAGKVLRIPRADLEQVMQKYPGMNLRDLADQFGVSHETVRRSLKDHGLKVDRSRVSRKKVLAAYERGATTPHRMSTSLGVEYTVAKNWMEYLNLIDNADSRAAIRATLPTCRVCGDPVDPSDPVWGGKEDVHFTCAAQECKQATIMYDRW